METHGVIFAKPIPEPQPTNKFFIPSTSSIKHLLYVVCYMAPNLSYQSQLFYANWATEKRKKAKKTHEAHQKRKQRKRKEV